MTSTSVREGGRGGATGPEALADGAAALGRSRCGGSHPPQPLIIVVRRTSDAVVSGDREERGIREI